MPRRSGPCHQHGRSPSKCAVTSLLALNVGRVSRKGNLAVASCQPEKVWGQVQQQCLETAVPQAGKVVAAPHEVAHLTAAASTHKEGAHDLLHSALQPPGDAAGHTTTSRRVPMHTS